MLKITPLTDNTRLTKPWLMLMEYLHSVPPLSCFPLLGGLVFSGLFIFQWLNCSDWQLQEVSSRQVLKQLGKPYFLCISLLSVFVVSTPLCSCLFSFLVFPFFLAPAPALTLRFWRLREIDFFFFFALSLLPYTPAHFSHFHRIFLFSRDEKIMNLLARLPGK